MKRITICSVIVVLSLLSFTHAKAAEPQRTPLPPAQIVRLDPLNVMGKKQTWSTRWDEDRQER